MEIVRLEISEELLALMPDGFPVESLLELEARAKAHGNVLSDIEVNNMLPLSVNTTEAIDFMLEYLQSKGITITYQKDEDDDLISSTDSAEIEQFKALVEKIRNLMSTLSSRERDVLEWRLGLKGGRSHTLEEVGQIYGVTRERIRQIEAKALRRLRSKRCTQLRDFVADSEYENDKDVKNDSSKDLLFDYFKMLENNPYLINLLNEEENKTDSEKDKIVFVSTEARIEQLEKDNKILLEIIQNHFEYIQNLKAEIKDLKEKYEGLKIEVRSPKVEKEIHFTKDKYIGEHNKRECIRIRFIYDFKKGSEFCSDIVGSIKYEGLGVAVIYSPRAKGWLLYTKKGVDSESMNEAVKLFKDILIKGIINGEY